MIKALSEVIDFRGYKNIASEFEVLMNDVIFQNISFDSLRNINFAINKNSLNITIYYDNAITTGGTPSCKIFQYDIRGYNKNLNHMIETDLNEYFTSSGLAPDKLDNLVLSMSSQTLFVFLTIAP
jgi:hypothetical protein